MLKKIMVITLMLTCLFGLVGCDPGVDRVDGAELLANTVKIELCHYENANPELFNLNGQNKPIFDFSKVTFIATLDEPLFEPLINDIAQQDCLYFGNALNEPIGKTLILYQENGNMVVLFSYVQKGGFKLTRYYGECNIFDQTGAFIEHIGRIDSDYVDTLESIYFETNS